MNDSGAARVAALEALLVEKGVVDPAAVDRVIEHYESDVGPLNGAKVIARAWTDPAYRQRLLADGTRAVAEFGFGGPEAQMLVAVENTGAPAGRRPARRGAAGALGHPRLDDRRWPRAESHR